jgi:YVTN family beta-propeller protein
VANNISVGISPKGIVVDDTTNKIYVANSKSDTVSVIDGDRDKVMYDIHVGDNPQTLSLYQPLGGISSLGPRQYDKIYVANSGSNNISVINGSSDQRTPIGLISVRDTPAAIAVNDLYDKIYVANYNNDTASVIDGSNDKKIEEIPVGVNPAAIVYDAGKIYVANYNSNTVSVIDASNYTKIGEPAVGAGPAAMAVDDTTYKIYVANYDDNTVSVINGSNYTKIATIQVGKAPNHIEVENVDDYRTANNIYVTNSKADIVSVINSSTGNVTNIRVGQYPIGIAANVKLPMMYVLNSPGNQSNTITVIDGLTSRS